MSRATGRRRSAGRSGRATLRPAKAPMASSHFDESGRAVMVDVTAKAPTLRTAVARARILMRKETLAAILEGRVAKGDVFAVARLAGISAAKKTHELIPLAHPLSIHSTAVDITADAEAGVVALTATVRAVERTGVEMEAMVAASVAALTLYDMCKGIDRGMAIAEVVLLRKDGGRSGPWRREGAE